MQLLAGHELRIAVVPGGVVEVTPFSAGEDYGDERNRSSE